MTTGETTPIPTFPLRGKEISFLQEEKLSLPLRGRARVGVVRLLRDYSFCYRYLCKTACRKTEG